MKEKLKMVVAVIFFILNIALGIYGTCLVPIIILKVVNVIDLTWFQIFMPCLYITIPWVISLSLLGK